MTYKLAFERQEVPISGYLVVYPFRFNPQGQLDASPDRVLAIVNVCETQRPDDHFTEYTGNLPEWSDFRILNDAGDAVLKLGTFALRVGATPHSLDMGRASWVLSGRTEHNSTVDFTPPKVDFREWNGDGRSQFFWGGEIADGNHQLLRASLSAPVYERSSGGQWYLREYFGAGPAHSHDGKSGASLFEWFSAHQATPPRSVNTLCIRDCRRSKENLLFGEQESGQQVDGDTYGALFAANGRLLEIPWPALRNAIRTMALDYQASADYCALMGDLPLTDVDQTMHGSMRSEPRSSDALGIRTFDFEGIALWGLRPRWDAAAVPIHL